MESLNSSSVAIDGQVVRRIREEKRLTQFYVSKVVAVTTDTVSRWENNRYPTIMRDNALKLAEALEVDLEEILKKENPATVVEKADLPKKSRKMSWFYLLLLMSVVLIALYALLPALNSSPVLVLQAKRVLPPYAAPGSRILIQVEISADMPLKGMILKEVFPPGWRFLESEPIVSHLDTKSGLARWIFRKPPLKTQVYYLLEVPEDIKSDANMTISGELIANPDGQRSATEVESVGKMQVQPFHWADSNGDQVIDDLEILELSDLTEAAVSLHLDWDLIESIWEAGGYQWLAAKKQFVPVPEP